MSFVRSYVIWLLKNISFQFHNWFRVLPRSGILDTSRIKETVKVLKFVKLLKKFWSRRKHERWIKYDDFDETTKGVTCSHPWRDSQTIIGLVNVIVKWRILFYHKSFFYICIIIVFQWVYWESFLMSPRLGSLYIRLLTPNIYPTLRKFLKR